jgi:PhzF family phenazine biosynthesis protein
MQQQNIIQVDAFTNQPFFGNPAAVCILSESHSADWMQMVAREMNLSETAFLIRDKDEFRLRWFTPQAEVDLCGHATLASAYVLWEDRHVPIHETIRFQTLSGLLTATRQDDWISMDFPAKFSQSVDSFDDLIESLHVTPLAIERNKFDYLVEVASEEEVKSIRPDMTKLASIQARGVIVTSRSTTPPFDFISRFFAPAVGIPEDPVTGSAHCCLAPYWGKKLHKSVMTGYQASERGGVVRVQIANDRVLLGGQAVIVLRGNILFP